MEAQAITPVRANPQTARTENSGGAGNLFQALLLDNMTRLDAGAVLPMRDSRPAEPSARPERAPPAPDRAPIGGDDGERSLARAPHEREDERTEPDVVGAETQPQQQRESASRADAGRARDGDAAPGERDLSPRRAGDPENRPETGGGTESGKGTGPVQPNAPSQLPSFNVAAVVPTTPSDPLPSAPAGAPGTQTAAQIRASNTVGAPVANGAKAAGVPGADTPRFSGIQVTVTPAPVAAAPRAALGGGAAATVLAATGQSAKTPLAATSTPVPSTQATPATAAKAAGPAKNLASLAPASPTADGHPSPAGQRVAAPAAKGQAATQVVEPSKSIPGAASASAPPVHGGAPGPGTPTATPPEAGAGNVDPARPTGPTPPVPVQANGTDQATRPTGPAAPIQILAAGTRGADAKTRQGEAVTDTPNTQAAKPSDRAEARVPSPSQNQGAAPAQNNPAAGLGAQVLPGTGTDKAAVALKTLAARDPGAVSAAPRQGEGAASQAGASSPGDAAVQGATPGTAAPRAAHARPARGPAVPVDDVAVNIKRAVARGDERIRIRLHPAELGQIDVKLKLDAHGVVKAVISVDRADTFDLMQRDARGLERALQDAGLKTDSGSLSFNLRGDGQSGSGGRNDAPRLVPASTQHGESSGPRGELPPEARPAMSNRVLDMSV